jgi:hypothetical protein
VLNFCSLQSSDLIAAILSRLLCLLLSALGSSPPQRGQSQSVHAAFTMTPAMLAAKKRINSHGKASPASPAGAGAQGQSSLAAAAASAAASSAGNGGGAAGSPAGGAGGQQAVHASLLRSLSPRSHILAKVRADSPRSSASSGGKKGFGATSPPPSASLKSPPRADGAAAGAGAGAADSTSAAAPAAELSPSRSPKQVSAQELFAQTARFGTRVSPGPAARKGGETSQIFPVMLSLISIPFLVVQAKAAAVARAASSSYRALLLLRRARLSLTSTSAAPPLALLPRRLSRI